MTGHPDPEWAWPSPSDPVTPGWRSVYIGVDGHVPALGFNPWDAKWRDGTPRTIIVAHPQYPQQRHKFWIHEIERSVGGTLRFAAGEYSNGIWGVYVPDPT